MKSRDEGRVCEEREKAEVRKSGKAVAGLRVTRKSGTYGPMDLWTYGPMDLWTYGPMDLWKVSKGELS
ncbi:hypothetical protein GCM10007086_21390 [Photobacterium aphoticum]|nr:hypothetical protein GCM10007086_21390 [Photobacterium aphoticum]